MMKRLAAMAALISIAGCSEAPERISAAYVSPLDYASVSCHDLKMEAVRVDDALSGKFSEQRRARNNDIAGLWVLGTTVSSSAGTNVHDQVADLKGRQSAIRHAEARKDCVVTLPQTDFERALRAAP